MSKVTFVQINYERRGGGLSILFLRENWVREYRYSYKHVRTLIRIAELRGYTVSSYPDGMTIETE